MFNQNSPIVNNMMLGGNGGIYSNGYIPANPIGNVVNIGNLGYNNMNNNNMGGYYNNAYNNYYNPYLAEQQRKIEEARMMEMQRQQSNQFKNLIKNVNRALGNGEVSDEDLQRYDPVDNQNEEYMMEQKIYQLMDVYNSEAVGSVAINRAIQHHNMMFEQARQEAPNDISMYDYQEVMSNQYLDYVMEQQKRGQNDISKLYNRDSYNKLIKMHSDTGTNYFNNMFNQDKTIDDMEVSLPTHMQNVYQDRKRAFLDSIMRR